MKNITKNHRCIKKTGLNKKLSEDVGGNWYAWDEQDMQGWLCPALFKYFKIAPRNIFVDIKEVKS